MSQEKTPQQEKLVSSECSLESEINTARINALELKLETLSIITESLWNLHLKSGATPKRQLQEEMANVIDSRADRDQQKTNCPSCKSLETASKGHCSQCGTDLDFSGEVSPFDY